MYVGTATVTEKEQWCRSPVMTERCACDETVMSLAYSRRRHGHCRLPVRTELNGAHQLTCASRVSTHVIAHILTALLRLGLLIQSVDDVIFRMTCNNNKNRCYYITV